MSNNSTSSKKGFTSSFGAIMAAAGSAVGLGNIWRFPYICGKYGGGAFLAVYVIFVFLIGAVLLISEFVIGRRTRQTPLSAYNTLSPKGHGWRWIGIAGLITSILIMGLYLVISGWTLSYTWDSISGTLFKVSVDGYGDYFNNFVSSAFRPVLFIFIFLVLCIAVILCGVDKGIERFSKILMPILVVLLVVLCVRSLTLEGSSAGVEYLLKPDFSKLTGAGILAALGQALFSLSCGMGVMIVYGSYLPADENIFKSTMWITLCDFLIAVLSGLAIFPAVFACGQSPAEGPGLVYLVLPVVFGSLGTIGRMLAIVFFVLLTLAALTSAISLLEAMTAWSHEKGRSRLASCLMFSLLVFAIAVLSSYGGNGSVLSNVKIFGLQIFDLVDRLTGTYLPPLTALFTIIFFTWVMKKEDIIDELSNHGTLKIPYFKVFYYFLARFVAPISLLIVFISGLLNNIIQ